MFAGEAKEEYKSVLSGTTAATSRSGTHCGKLTALIFVGKSWYTGSFSRSLSHMMTFPPSLSSLQSNLWELSVILAAVTFEWLRSKIASLPVTPTSLTPAMSLLSRRSMSTSENGSIWRSMSWTPFIQSTFMPEGIIFPRLACCSSMNSAEALCAAIRAECFGKSCVNLISVSSGSSLFMMREAAFKPSEANSALDNGFRSSTSSSPSRTTWLPGSCLTASPSPASRSSITM